MIKIENKMNKTTKEIRKWSHEAFEMPSISRNDIFISQDDISVPQFINNLCVRLCDDMNESSSITKKRIVKQLKIQAFQILLKKSSPNSDKGYYFTDKNELIATLLEQIYFNSIRSSTWSKKKNQEVRRLIDKLSNGIDEKPFIGDCIAFLLSVSESIQCHSYEGKNKLDSCLRSLQSSSVNVCNSNNYGISPHNYKLSNNHPSIFDLKMMIDCPANSKRSFSKISDIKDFPFESDPGKDLTLFEKFSPLWSSNNKSSRSTNVFSDKLGMKSLSIPELNLDVPRSLTIPSLKSSHLDEGYVTPDKEYLDEHENDSYSKKSSFDVWRTLTTVSLNDPVRYTWESLGRVEVNKEPPFLLQSSLDVIECWKRHRQFHSISNNINVMNDSTETVPSIKSDEEANPDQVNTITHKEFFRDVKCLLIGIETKTFFFNKGLNTFVLKPGISIPGITPAGLEIYSKDLIECGNNFRTLNLLVRRNNKNEKSVSDANFSECTLATNDATSSIMTCNSEAIVNRGLVFEAMCTSICCWLQAYRGVVIKMIDPASRSLLDVKKFLHPLQQQLKFLVNLCCSPSSSNIDLPTGGALLTHIYNVVQVTISVPFLYILCHILENCLKVYFRFLENWLFEGICEDLYGEFFIEQRSNHETTKDRSYWRKTFFIRHERVPVFLSNLVNDIFVCGKTLNLVKFCNPNDSLCQRLENIYPRMSPCFEENSLNRLSAEYQEYVSSCEKMCAAVPLTKILSPGYGKGEDEECHFEVVGQQRAKSLEKIKKEKEDMLKKKDEQKRQLFEERRNDMLEARKRKVEERQKEIRDDLKRLDENVKEAEIEAARKVEERQRMIDFYKSLSDAADCRKLRAEWKINRLKLNDKRINFLVKDKFDLKEELFKVKQAQFYYDASNQDESNQNNLMPAEPNSIMHSASSSCSWLTCPSLSRQPSNCNNNFLVKDDAEDVINAEVVENINVSLRSNSSSNLLTESDCIELRLKRSSSATNIFASANNGSTYCENDFGENIDDDNLNNNQMSDVNLPKVVKFGFVRSACSPSTFTKSNENIASKTVDNNLLDVTNRMQSTLNNNINTANDTSLLEDDSNKSQSVDELFVLTNNDYRSVADNSVEKENEVESFSINYDIEGKNLIFSKMYSDARNAALLNKQKVYEAEYGVSDVVKGKMKKEKDDVNSCKDKVLENKNKVNDSVVKERTEALALASFNFVQSRKEAARNKARVMNSEFSVITGNSVKKGKEQINLTVSNGSIKSLTDRISEEKMSAFPACNDDDNAKQNYYCEGIKTEIDKKHSFTILNSEFVDANGRFIMDKKPIIVDIADKFISQKSDLLLNFDSANNTTIHFCLYKSVAIPTEIQKSFTNDAILRLFIINEKFLDHLQCIRNYFFLLDGEYGRSLTRHLFTDLENVEQPCVFLTYLHLNSILSSAIRSSPHSESQLIEKLSFFVKDTPLAFVLTDTEALNCLAMRYRVRWPLNIILTNDAIVNYDRIFAFQLKLQRAAWALEQDMQLLKMRNMMKSSHFRQLQIFRHGMTHFVRAISNYIIRIALEESWVEFKNNLSKAHNLDSLYTAHVDYVKMVLFRCLLNKRSETIQKTIMELLKNILCFHELLRTGEWVYDLETGNHTHSAFTRLSHHYSNFIRILRYLVKFLNQVICRGYQPHLDVLITFLSGNDFYSEKKDTVFKQKKLKQLKLRS